jgi:hypothetical protein
MDDESDWEVTYYLATVQALRSHWHIPYNYVTSGVSMILMAVKFSPIRDDLTWKGKSLRASLRSGYNERVSPGSTNSSEVSITNYNQGFI